MDTHRRTAAKAVSWRILATIITGCVTLMVTGRVKIALSIGLLDSIVKLGIYYAHERAWNRVSFGRAKSTDYEI